ncbi:hypothetical protein [Rhodovulum marinum]|uniref:Uncharacterized protein n=1 Tax=Rhodovulum marinum TaxID=320662 RepID=A0A4R2PYD0_9RHOB|nr:hypothetical protein [Rhodovulum marinum]TCP39275.1 hypothetical protein EV662_11352 [Rhodovulum marinum]
MPKRLWSLAPLAVLAFAGWQSWDTLRHTPAFNRSLQVENVLGGTRSFREGSMYHRAEYLYQVGYGYRHATLTLMFTQGLEAFKKRMERNRAATEAAGGVVQNEYTRARDLALASLRLRPSDAHTWLLLASAQEELGAPDRALEALLRAQAMAPYSIDMAEERLDLAAELRGAVEADAALRPLVRANAATLGRTGRAMNEVQTSAIVDLLEDVAAFE